MDCSETKNALSERQIDVNCADTGTSEDMTSSINENNENEITSQIIVPVANEEKFVIPFPLGRTKPVIRARLKQLNLDMMLNFKKHGLLKAIYRHIVRYGLKAETMEEDAFSSTSTETARSIVNAASRALLWMFRSQCKNIRPVTSVSDICLKSLTTTINAFYFIHLTLYQRGSILHFLRNMENFVLLISEIHPSSTSSYHWHEMESILIKRIRHLRIRARALNCVSDSMARYNRVVPDYKELMDSLKPMKNWLKEQLHIHKDNSSLDALLFKQIGVATNLFIILENGQRSETIYKLRYEDYLRMEKYIYRGDAKYLIPFPLNKSFRSNQILVLSQELRKILRMYVRIRNKVLVSENVEYTKKKTMLFVAKDGKEIKNSLRVLRGVAKTYLHSDFLDTFTMITIRNSVANTAAGKLLYMETEKISSTKYPFPNLMGHNKSVHWKNYITKSYDLSCLAHSYLEKIAEGVEIIDDPATK